MLFAVFNLVLVISITLGYLIHTFIPKDIYFGGESKFGNITTYILTGVFIQICLVAICVTCFKTVFVLPILVLFAYVVVQSLKSEFRIQFERPEANVLTIFLLSFLIFLIHQYFFIDLNDFVFYSKLSKSIFEIGIESNEALYPAFIPVSKGFELYHFGELWLTAAYSKLFMQDTFEVYCYIILPLFHFINILTFSSILSALKINGLINILWCVSIIYGAIFLVFPILIPEKGHYTFWFYSLPDVTSLKSLITLPIIFLLCFAVYQNKMRNSVLLAFGLAILNIVFIPLLFLTFIYFVLTRIESITDWLSSKRIRIFWIILFFSAIFLSLLALSPSLKQSPLFQRYIFSPVYYWNNRINFIVCFRDYFSRSWILFPVTLIGVGVLCFSKASNQFKRVLLFHTFVVVGLSLLIVLFKDVPNITQILSLYLQGGGVMLTLFVFIEIRSFSHFRLILAGMMSIAVLNIVKTKTTKQQFYKDEKAAIAFWVKLFTHKNLVFVSHHTWSNFWYNSEILALPIFRSDKVNLPFDVTPCFDSNRKFSEYLLLNRNYPIKRKNQIGVFLKNRNVQFLLIHGSRVDELTNIKVGLKKCGNFGNYAIYKCT
jgi:hypothetical protein